MIQLTETSLVRLIDNANLWMVVSVISGNIDLVSVSQHPTELPERIQIADSGPEIEKLKPVADDELVLLLLNNDCFRSSYYNIKSFATAHLKILGLL